MIFFNDLDFLNLQHQTRDATDRGLRVQPRPSDPVPGLRLLRAARAQGDGQQVQPQARGRSLSHLGSEAQRRQGNGVDLPDRGVRRLLLNGYLGQILLFFKALTSNLGRGIHLPQMHIKYNFDGPYGKRCCPHQLQD